jgi:hypothetical protein
MLDAILKEKKHISVPLTAKLYRQALTNRQCAANCSTSPFNFFVFAAKHHYSIVYGWNKPVAPIGEELVTFGANNWISQIFFCLQH